ncbi:MAG: cyclic nucleotide-binding domain-containing protein [candidate division NC10 bacterium]|nr:cyclic nucleotide-binding domain-containing protein [candidate division NC10 bacterium]MBI2116069.1 cyclic nucleotide-binding domain-containing protein [candidate division NC10 bacterium]MBI2162596.1 cyclic nucleotide-binding domain-containing protein [candidate division NC10 bacterium]MBI2454919.1 cyclic nucleotide-binding domain-containing protein [candidate division NC10 bacterium]MBI3121960.1 cyclic nucleotide-binding domain-containing protein [candidate division NC10 bacterium]
MSARRGLATALHPDYLRRLGFFREFTPPELRRLAALAGLRSYRDGELVGTEGTRKQRRSLYVVLQGELQYVKRVRGEHATILLTLRPGDVGGFLTFFSDDPSPVSVRSVGRSRVFEIGRREFQGLMADHPSLAAKVLQALLRATVARLDVLLGQVAATSAWVLEMEQHLQALPLTQK